MGCLQANGELKTYHQVAHFYNVAVEQFNGREGETAALFGSYVVTFSLCVIGFAPRHLNRWALLGECRR